MSVTYSGGIASVTQADGSQIAFVYYPVGATEPVGSNGVTWCPSDAASAVFCPSAPRDIATLAQSGGGGWTFVNALKSPVTYSFSAAGVLTAIGDAGGDSLASSSYSPGAGQASCPTGDTCTAWSSTPSGESAPSAVLVEAFNSNSQLVSVFDAASGAASTQLATFTYSGSGCSTWSGTPQDLCSVTDPGSLTTRLTYDTSQASPYQYDETAMVPPATGQVTNTYNSSGQVTKQIVSTGGTNEEQDFAYAPNANVVDGTQTTVTSYPNGTGGASSNATYVYSNDVEVSETDATGAITNVNRDPSTLLASNTVNANGNISSQVFDEYSASGGTPTSSADLTLSTDALGNTTQTLYTSHNLPYCSMSAADYQWGQAQSPVVSCPTTPPTTPPTAATGYTITIYNAADDPTFVTDALGNTTANSYTASGSGVPANLLYCTVAPVSYKAGVTCPAYGAAHVAGTATKTFDAVGDTLTSTDADGNTTSYVYGSAAHPGMPTVTTDPDGKVTTDTYNAEGQVTTQVVTDTAGTYSATTQYGYDTSGRKFCEVDPYDYSTGVRCPSSVPTSPPTGTPGYTDTIYNSEGQVLSTTSPIGGTTQYAYDGSGNKYCTVSPTNYANGTRCPTSLPLTVPTPGSDSYLGATIDTFDADNRVIQVTNPLGGITLSTFDDAGNMETQTVESNNSTSDPNIVSNYGYDGDNRLTSTVVDQGTASQATTLTAYDPDGNAFCTVSANATYSGDYQCPAWQPGWITTPPSPTSLYSTTPTASQANDVTTSFFNADGTKVQTTNPDLQTSITAVDGDQRTYCTSDPTNVASWLTANPTGVYPYLCPSSPPTTPPTLGSNPGYVTTIVDAAGRTLSTTDQVGDTTVYTYDGSGNQLTVTDPRGKVTTNCYFWESATGQCAAGAPAGSGSYDDLYSTTTPATTADPSGETTTHTYLPGDTAHVTTTPSGTTTDSYDASLDMTGVAFSGTVSGYSTPANQSYTFFADGTRHTMTDGSGMTTYTEDANGDVTQQQFTAGGGTGLANKTVAYGYFSTGVEASVTYPSYGSHSSPQETYTYDGVGNLISATDWLGNQVTFTHDGDGNLTSQDNAVSTSNPNGTSGTTLSYDDADLNTQASSTLAQTCSGSNETLTQSFSGTTGSRNPDGQVTQDAESYAGSCSSQPSYQRDYSYDPAGRVVYQGTAAQGSSPNSISYDASGDPTQIASHDANGNYDTYTQTFDNAGEVQGQTPVSGSAGSTSTYSYDTLGDRTSSVTGSTTTNYGYNQLGQMTSSVPNAKTLYTGDGLEAASYNTPTWGTAVNIDSLRTLESVSCTSATFCAVVDHTGHAFTYNGSSWSTPNQVDAARSLNSVSCTSSSFCVAVDGQGYALTYNGSSWSSPFVIDSSKTLHSVSCASSSFCVAAASSGGVVFYNGSTWTVNVIDGSRGLDAVSCPTTTFCVALDGAGRAFTTSNGTTWSSATDVDGSNTLDSVSCTSATFCVAVDAVGNALTYNGSSWASTDVDGSTVLDSVSCSSSTFCQAVDDSGNALAFNGSSWSSPTEIDSTNVLEGVICLSATLCGAVDNIGNAIWYRAGTAVSSQFIWDTNSSLALTLSDGTNDYVYGPTGEPVEQVNVTSSPPTNNPTFMTYTPSDSSWLITNAAGDQTNFYRYDAFGTLAVGTQGSPFGYAGQYQDSGIGTSGFDNMRARWYDGQTGEFTTRDSAFSSTDTAYTYAGDDPVNRLDSTGLATIGVCAGFNVAPLIFSTGAGDCLVRTIDNSGEDDIGVTGAPFFGAGIGVNADVAFYYQVSNATNLHELGGYFTYANVTADFLGGGTVSVFWNNTVGSGAIYGIDVGVTLGGGLSGNIGESYTFVNQFNNRVTANIARGLWDTLNPGLAIQLQLNRAKELTGRAQATAGQGSSAC